MDGCLLVGGHSRDYIADLQRSVFCAVLPGNGWGHICIETLDVYRACDDLAAMGIKITRPPGPMKHGTTLLAFVKDPDGFLIELLER